MTTSENSVARHDEIRRQHSRRTRVTPLGVNLNEYYGISDQIILVTAEAGPLFIQGRTGTLYFFLQKNEGFSNAYGDASFGCWQRETPDLAPAMTSLPLAVDHSVYRATPLEGGLFLHADAAKRAPPGQATLALAFQVAPGHYPCMARDSVATAKADFEQARPAKPGTATPSN